MSAQVAMYAAGVTLIVVTIILAAVDDALQSKADADLQRHADDAIDLTSGAR